MGNLILTALQLSTSVARLAAFAFSVLVIGTIEGTAPLLLVIGYLPFLAFFDILIQSSSRAAHLHGAVASGRIDRLHSGYALGALFFIVLAFIGGFWFPEARQLLVLGAWPLGAIGFVWERRIAKRLRQWLLSTIELSLLALTVALQQLAGLPWPLLLLCIVSFPVARLVVLALPSGPRGSEPAPTAPLPDDPQPAAAAGATASRRRGIGGYVSASLAQQLIAAAAASLPAIYAQVSGDWDKLSLHVAVFRSLHSLAAIVSLTINAMSSRIFYRQVGTGFETLEGRFLDAARPILAVVMLVIAAAGCVALVGPANPTVFALTILPAMAIINAESSLLYNRGLPIGTMHCQILILLLSCAFMTLLVGPPWGVAVALAIFTGYGAFIIPGVLRLHRQALNRI
ncbi:hypothetical protein [Sphingomonas turrisvirgatae]|uniref:Uncharacterized protein n=1 Tax=Sphingomonas turrisvirgatae TaxID=1888892 RepID=A0A1E3LZC8_9SPHN|nr:hypothetical protein [Sphingomonas turrisvirgatae]ODP39094.1 hypothetical protein BFL28_12095 [Sphingomonas turrisvirgatae]